MAYETYNYTFICLCVCFILPAIFAQEACDKSKCRGPIAYYESLRCTPVYGSQDFCCAVEYNCDHLKERSKNKCYINGNVYDIGTPLEDEDALPCDIGCSCSTGQDGIAGFNCGVVDCPPELPVPSECYRRRNFAECCNGEEVCPQNVPGIPQCNVDGKIYYDGQTFQPTSDPELNCICQEGYTGLNVEPFCKRINYCRPELLEASNIHNNCAPVYYDTQNPATDCSLSSRCQNNNDTVVKSGSSTTPRDSDYYCTFGNLMMKLGDELNQATDYSSICVKCVCEVPPLPTCRRLADSECVVTAQPPFQLHINPPTINVNLPGVGLSASILPGVRINRSTRTRRT